MAGLMESTPIYVLTSTFSNKAKPEKGLEGRDYMHFFLRTYEQSSMRGLHITINLTDNAKLGSGLTGATAIEVEVLAYIEDTFPNTDVTSKIPVMAELSSASTTNSSMDIIRWLLVRYFLPHLYFILGIITNSNKKILTPCALVKLLVI